MEQNAEQNTEQASDATAPTPPPTNPMQQALDTHSAAPTAAEYDTLIAQIADAQDTAPNDTLTGVIAGSSLTEQLARIDDGATLSIPMHRFGGLPDGATEAVGIEGYVRGAAMAQLAHNTRYIGGTGIAPTAALPTPPSVLVSSIDRELDQIESELSLAGAPQPLIDSTNDHILAIRTALLSLLSK